MGTGAISIGSVTGDLKALTKEGDIDVYLVDHNNVHLRSRQGSFIMTYVTSPQCL